jgi:hypothetical protein
MGSRGGRRGTAQQAAPSRAFAGGHLIALVDPKLAVVFAVDGDRIVQVDHPAGIHVLQDVEDLRCAVHVLLEADNDEL